MEIEPSELAPTLVNLVEISDLVVDATVLDVLPTFNVAPPQGRPVPRTPQIETHATLSISSSIVGSLPGGLKEIVIAQPGGIYGDWKTVSPDVPTLLPGRRYILFLIADKRPVPANTTGYPRYYIAGVWSGFVNVASAGAIQFAPRASDELHTNDGADVASFTGRIQDLATIYRNQRYTKVSAFSLCHKVDGRCVNK